MPTISASHLCEFASRLLSGGGVEQGEAKLIATSLVGANLRGHDSHGVMRIPYYLEALRLGEVVTGASWTVLHEGPAIVVADGHWGFGQTQAQRLTASLIEKARSAGVATGTLVHASHVGRLGEYCELAAAAGLVSLMMVNAHGAGPRVAPPGGKAPRLGTNPLAFGVPTAGQPLVLDFGTSATAEGKVRIKRIAGQLCPEGWLLDSDGQPTRDPQTLYGDPPGTIRPMGGDQAYKGFGLGLMVEIFAGAFSGGLCVREKAPNQVGNCVFLQLIDPQVLSGRDHFAREVTDLVAYVRSCPRIDPDAPIQLPGDPERTTLAKRTAHGIPLDEGNWQQLAALAKKLGIAVPEC